MNSILVFTFLASLSVIIISYVVFFIIGRSAEKEWNSEEALIKVHRHDWAQEKSPPRRQDTSCKRRYFYGDDVCGHDRNYLKAALKAYIKGHYYFNYHSKQFRTPEIWK
ncbi:MAG: hypothetical protein VB046_06815 [Paludibacter sp.]|nr:hypothetical protein [Paludibacter sp.]